MMDLRELHYRHDGERAYILGNGPSLAQVDLAALRSTGVVMGSNRIYLSGFVPDYYAVVNPLVLKQYWKEIAELDTVKFISTGALVSSGLARARNKRGQVVPIDTSLNIPAFGNPEGVIWEGHTVTYVLLQLAYYMGFSEVVLMGVDHYYGAYSRYPNAELIATGADQHHFHPDYFTGGTRWHAPDLANSEIAYSLARKQFESNGRHVVNASVSTALRVFDLEPYPRALELGYKPRVSAIVSAYKCADFLDGCLSDLFAQSEDLEVVLVCQEGSAEEQIARGFDLSVVGHRNPYRQTGCLRIITTSDIPGIYTAWNLGVRAARGKYLTNANSDDRCHPMKYEIMADILDARPDIDVVYADQLICWDNPMTFNEFQTAYAGKLLRDGRYEGEAGIFRFPDYSRNLLGQHCFLGSAPMWRASLHQLYGYFGEHYKIAGDYEFWLRVARDANMLHIPYPLGVYCARLDGVELSDPVTALDESQRAIMLHQSPGGLEIVPRSEAIVQMTIGGEWTFVRISDVLGAMQAEVES